MSYIFHCYKSKLGYPDLEEAKETIENYDPVSELQRQEVFEIAQALIAFNPELAISSFDDARIAALQNISIEKVKSDYLHIELNPKNVRHPIVKFLNQSILLQIEYPLSYNEYFGIENTMAYLKLINNISSLLAYDEQAMHSFNPNMTTIEFEDGIISYKETKQEKDDQTHKKEYDKQKRLVEVLRVRELKLSRPTKLEHCILTTKYYVSI